MDCCNSNYHYHHRTYQHPPQSYYHHYPHHSPALGSGYYDGPLAPPPPPPSYHAAAHVAEYYSPAAVVGGGCEYSAGNAPFHMAASYYHPQMNGWNGGGVQRQSHQPSDYVYNPKEARIRKALRDATREKILSASAGMPPQGDHHQRQRRPAQPWMLPDHEDQIMMSPGEPGSMGGGALRAGMASPMCGMGFPIGMAPMGSSYPSPMHHPHAAYLNSPLAQLQHQTDLWNPYHHKSQTKSPQDVAYLMSHQPQPHHMQSPYAHIPPISFSPTPSATNHHTNDPNKDSHHHDQLPVNTTSSPPTTTTTDLTKDNHCRNKSAKMEQPDTPPSEQEVIMPNGNDETAAGKTNEFEAELGKPTTTTLITRDGFQQQEKIVLQNPFDVQHHPSTSNGGGHMMTAFNTVNHQQNMQRKKSTNHQRYQHQQQQMIQHPPPSPSYPCSSTSCSTQHRNVNTTTSYYQPQMPVKQPVKPLPDFNEAFGSTERGRYQSPPNKIKLVGQSAKSDCVDFLDFFGNDSMKLEDYHI